MAKNRDDLPLTLVVGRRYEKTGNLKTSGKNKERVRKTRGENPFRYPKEGVGQKSMEKSRPV